VLNKLTEKNEKNNILKKNLLASASVDGRSLYDSNYGSILYAV
jgi:hypothetical protein